MNKRIEEIRKDLGFSMEKFGNKIGISKSAVNQIEKGINNPSEQTISLICKEFDINEEWLRNGKGEKKKKVTVNQEVAEFINDIMELPEEDFKKNIIYSLASLSTEEWEALQKLASRFLKKD